MVVSGPGMMPGAVAPTQGAPDASCPWETGARPRGVSVYVIAAYGYVVA